VKNYFVLPGAAGRALAGAALGLLLGACPGKLGSQQGHAPEQPIAFSHALHAGLYELDCQYCHAGAERSRHAGVPPASLCLNCHSQVKTGSPEIVKLKSFVDNDAPVPWVKVHRLPDFAFFSHASHVSGGLPCQTCHGPVQEMVRVQQQETMTMGWCLNCHRNTRDAERDAPLPLATLLAEKAAAPDRIPSRHLAPPTDCSACHR